jgi:hypothetical protein
VPDGDPDTLVLAPEVGESVNPAGSVPGGLIAQEYGGVPPATEQVVE